MKTNITKAPFVIVTILLGISLVSIFPYFLNDSIFSQDDLLFHRTRLESYYQAVKHLNFFPRVFQNMGLNFGYAADLFYPSILLFPFALFRIIGIDFVASYYLYQLLISFITASTAYYFMYSIKQSNKMALLFSCFYTLSTYRLIDQSVRAALGETLAFSILPLLVLSIYSIFYTNTQRWQLLGISMSLLIASHLITALYSFIFLVAFILIQWKKCQWAQIQNLLKSGALAIGLSAWFLLPYFEQVYHTIFNFSKVQLWATGLNFSLGDLFVNSLSSMSAPFTDLKPNIGLLLLGTVVIALCCYPKLTPTNKKLTLLAICSIGLATNIFPWALFKVSILATIQFPWRLLLFTSFFTSLLAVCLMEQFHLLSTKNVLILLGLSSFLTLSFNMNNIEKSMVQNNLTVTNKNVTSFYESEIGHGKEYLVKDTDFKKYFSSPTLFLDGVPYENSPSQTLTKYNYDQYILRTNGTQEVQLPKFYYIGYEVKDNQKVIQYYNKDGVVAVKLPKGIHTVTISYKKTTIQKLSTLFSLLLAGFLILNRWIRRNQLSDK
ncbi:YfhO family protein [Candidatus Enterococcus mansonii]|uniref:Membrane protein 6-pyruvoyl-tetrahydropterin synthase-related domain-containing protein n=1 Tax=Candidatus Enterococcus mansonii TaxID=1834181 RepID=A0A242CK76_9ENTE|nr:YfhO family protein [Enterococcus sp. 4G2_DIV0659]OTO10654.1 hypothetical protein A5880_001338 [Enterococcus sp. 4G2_DIV0659]